MLVFFTLLNYSYAFNPPCTSCKWFIPNKKVNNNNNNNDNNNDSVNDYGLCGFYKHNYELRGNVVTIYEFAAHCRNKETMCGEKGYMYESNDEKYVTTTRELKNTYEELSNRCCGEVNETSEIEQLEREMFEVMQKIKKHNTRHIYKTTQDLYKLFKRDGK